MKNLKIAHRYAKALFDLAQEQKSVDSVQDDLKAIAGLVEQSPELDHFLKDPVVSFEKQKEVLDALFKKKIQNLTLTFLLFLAERKKLSHTASIAEIFAMYYAQAHGILSATLTAPVPLRDDQIKSIAQKLKNYFNEEIEPKAEVDPELIGGFKVQVGDIIFDYSIRSQLTKFQKSVLQAA